MTEAEWLACDDPERMLRSLKGVAGDRKLRLFTCACFRLRPDLAPVPDVCELVAAAERLADGSASVADLRAAAERLGDRLGPVGLPPPVLRHLLAHLTGYWERAFRGAAIVLPGPVAEDREEPPAVPVGEGPAADLMRDQILATRAALRAVRAESCALLRCVFGGPRLSHRRFRWLAGLLGGRSDGPRARADPEWLTSTVTALARQVYESRDFSAMPILADALQDAGCDHDDILDHCRGPGPHVRGCWVVDLVLGKG